MIKPLTCETLSGLDNGLFGRVVDSEIRRIIDDIEDRGHDGNKRTLLIQISFQKDVSRDPHSPEVHVDPQVVAKLPPLRSGITTAKVASVVGGEVTMIFRDDNAENVNQPTIYDTAAGGERPAK